MPTLRITIGTSPHARVVVVDLHFARDQQAVVQHGWRWDGQLLWRPGKVGALQPSAAMARRIEEGIARCVPCWVEIVPERVLTTTRPEEEWAGFVVVEPPGQPPLAVCSRPGTVEVVEFDPGEVRRVRREAGDGRHDSADKARVPRHDRPRPPG